MRSGACQVCDRWQRSPHPSSCKMQVKRHAKLVTWLLYGTCFVVLFGWLPRAHETSALRIALRHEIRSLHSSQGALLIIFYTCIWWRAGSPLISRDSWQALLRAQDFQHVVVAGCDSARPPMLDRQSVVVGVSDGVIYKPNFDAAAAALSAAAAARRKAAADAAAAHPADDLTGPTVDNVLQVVTASCFRIQHAIVIASRGLRCLHS